MTFKSIDCIGGWDREQPLLYCGILLVNIYLNEWYEIYFTVRLFIAFRVNHTPKPTIHSKIEKYENVRGMYTSMTYTTLHFPTCY